MRSFRSQTLRKPMACGLFIVGALLVFAIPLIADHNTSLMAQTGKKDSPELNVFTPYAQAIGAVDPDGNVYALHGNLIGKVDADGSIFNLSKIGVGKVDPDGNVYNQSGTLLCRVKADGTIYNNNGNLIGSVKDAGGNVVLIGGAARLLVLRKSLGSKSK